MQITVSKLRDALSLLDSGVGKKKNGLPLLQCVLLGDGVIRATNLDRSVSLALREADGMAPVLLQHKILQQTLAYIPGHQVLDIQARKDGSAVDLTTDGSKLEMARAGDVSDFPPMAGPDPVIGQGSVDGDVLVPWLQAIAPYAARDNSRPVLSGVCVTLGDGPVKLAAADGFRLGYTTLPVSFPGEAKHRLIVPVETAGALAPLWRASARGPGLGEGPSNVALRTVAPRLMRVAFSETQLQLRFGNVTFSTALIAGDFPDYEQLIPTGDLLEVTVFAEEFERAVHRAAPISEAGAEIIRLSWADGVLHVVGRSEDIGRVEATVRAVAGGKGQGGNTAFKCGFLLSYLKGKQGLLTIRQAEPSSPASLTMADDVSVVIMPMFVQPEEKGKPEEQSKPAAGKKPRSKPARGAKAPEAEEGQETDPSPVAAEAAAGG